MRLIPSKPVFSSLADLAAPTQKGRRYGRWALRGILCGLLLAVAGEVARVLFLTNLHPVVPGRVYRSAQLSGDRLHDTIKDNGIRTVVNLRGRNPWMDWYKEQCAIAHDLNVSMEDVTLSANRLPARSELRQLIDVLDHSDHPILIHCRQGADRTGLVSALYLMLYTPTDYATARKQCGPRYAHLPVLSTAQMDRFFEMYEGWLAAKGTTHSPAALREWVLDVYRPDPAPVRLEVIGSVPELEIGQPVTLRVRATNLSNETWQMKMGRTAGVCIRYQTILDSQLIATDHAGLFDATVPPGESVEIVLPFRGFTTPGRYRVTADMFRHPVSFSQLGSEPLYFELTVRQPKER